MQPVRAARPPTAGPLQSAELRTPLQLEAEGFKSAGRLRRALNDGSLHGHRERDIRNARWSVPLAVAGVWKAGGSEWAQRAACPRCPDVDLVPFARRRVSGCRG